MSQFFAQRRAGLLLHPTSLPGPGGQGSLGHEAYRFVDFLAAGGMSVWQMLPLGPTHGDLSPYQCLSTNAGNTALISLAVLVEEGWLKADVIPHTDEAVQNQRGSLLEIARNGFRQHATEQQERAYEAFVRREAKWLDDYALYQALRQDHQGCHWVDWPAVYRDRDPIALTEARQRLAGRFEQVRFEQFVFFEQWHRLREYANSKDVLLYGDMPIFVAHDSAEVWAQRQYFLLDKEGHPTTVAGVPPDYFSATGQRWGNPHYHWQQLKEENFDWWVERLRTQMELFDLVRIDHFRGFEAFWAIPAEEETAINGRWIKAPGDELFERLKQVFPDLPVVAEDLGVITEEVDALREKFGLPGMKILQFAFGDDGNNPYLPHNHFPLSVVYTGTHDNDTTCGWYEKLSISDKDKVREYLAWPEGEMPWPLIHAALASVSGLAIIPMQDILGLDSSHRMNTPGIAQGNWRWRFDWDDVPTDLAHRLHRLTELYGRLRGG